MHWASRWCDTSRTSRRGGRPTCILHASHCQVLLVCHHLGCIQPHSTRVRWVHFWCASRRTKDGGYEEDVVCVDRMCHRVSVEIGRVMWMEHINYEHIHKLHMPVNIYRFLWKRECEQSLIPVFCSLKCRIRSESFDFLFRFPMIRAIVDDLDM
jgi:hypothetical protein